MACTALIIVILLQCLLTSCNEVLRFQLTKQEEVSAIHDLAAILPMDFWQFPNVARPTDVYIDASRKTTLVEKLQQLGVRYDVIIPDVAKLVEEERRSNSAARRRRKRSAERRNRNESVVGYYASYDEIMNWMNKLNETVPIAHVFSIGQSSEGRDLRVLKLSTGTNRPAIFFNSGMHARERMAVAAVNYMIEKLIEAYLKNDREVKNVLSKMDLYILPMLNPDGYEFTFTTGSFAIPGNFTLPNRYWRKNRKPYGKCKGADPNRNFDFHFGGEGSSTTVCSQLYQGPTPFSEPEAAAMRNLILSMGSKLKAYIDVHCCANWFLMPWLYTRTVRPQDLDEMTRVATIATNRMKTVNNKNYTFGSDEELYPASGTALDWVKGVAGVKYSYCLELWSNGTDAVFVNFFPPVSDIGPSGEETYAGIMAVASEIAAILP